MSPEQIVVYGAQATTAALVDLWGRLHRLDAVTHVGRVLTGPTLCILTPSVSRNHARLSSDAGSWNVRDLGSSGGTFVEDVRIGRSIQIRDHTRIRFGNISFYFLEDAPRRVAPARTRAAGATPRAPSEEETSRPTLEFDARPTPPPDVVFEVHQPTGGGGALFTVNGRSVQLTIAQLDLIQALIARIIAEEHLDPNIRGFVSVDELLAALSLESTDAMAVNVRHLVRRVRALLFKAGIGDAIESRRGRGYRLRWIPRQR